jgi:hypothetical protein
LEIDILFFIFNKKINMARYQQQMNVAMERLDQGLARVHSLVKRGQNEEAVRFMENNLRELFEELQNIINIEPGRDGSKIGML